MSETLELWDYRRQVASTYAAVRAMGVGADSWRIWRTRRDELFATHPQTPIEDLDHFEGLPYFEYHARWSTLGTFVSTEQFEWGEFTRVGHVEFSLDGQESRLPVFWLNAYGGGVFIPFKDGTSGASTYGGGRYLLDTVKGADLGHQDDQMVLDFNFSYHPSCVHSSRWTCPLAPVDAHIDQEITAGERLR